VSYEVVEAQTFWDRVMSMRRDDAYQASLMESLVELRRQPFKNPTLQGHDVGRALNGKTISSSHVGGHRKDRRLISQVFDKTLVVLLHGPHAEQERAKRMRISFDPADHSRCRAPSSAHRGA